MRNLKKQLTPDIERALIADAENSDAWESPVSVPPKRRTHAAWYGRDRIPIGITVAAARRDVNAHEFYEFIARKITGAAAYTCAPTGIAAASVDFYLVLSALASVASLANVLWTAYDRFIGRPKNQKDNSASIHLVVTQDDGFINLDLTNVSDKEAFVEQLTLFVSEAKRPELRVARETTIQELEESGLWIKINDR